MKKFIIGILWVLVICFSFQIFAINNTFGAIVESLNGPYASQVSPVGGQVTPDGVDTNTWNETYTGQTLVPYPSHDGYAVLDGLNDEFWVKGFNFVDPDPSWYYFNITNDTPYWWSDYHFVFEDAIAPPPGTPPVPVEPLTIIDAYGGPLEQWSFDGYELQFFSDANTVAPQSVLRVGFLVGSVDSGSMIMTQFPTTVPEPTAMLLFGFGLLGLAGAGRRKK